MPDYLIPSGRLLTTGDFLEVGVRKVMHPGVVAISENASLADAYQALVGHRIHAILVVGSEAGTPLGWATASGMLAYANRDRALVSARDAITEEAHTISRTATVADAIRELSRVDATHLVVTEAPGSFPIGTISDLDVTAFLGHRGS